MALVTAGAPIASAESAESRELANGLMVRVLVRPEATEVGVAVAYRVGQRDDPPGYAGLAHLAEHVAFRDTKHLPGLAGYAAVAAAGGRTNGKTGFDTTVYTHALPPGALERALWVESERMGFLVEAVTSRVLELEQRIVVRELELRRGTDFGPGFALERTFPKDHPYHQSSDEVRDVEAVTLPGMQGFLQRYYRPDLAVVAVVGPVDPSRVFAAVERYFGPIPRPSQDPPRRPSELPRRACYAAEGSVRGQGFVFSFWRTRAPGPPGALELLAATLESRLRRAADGLASTVSVRLHRWDLETILSVMVRAKGASIQRLLMKLRREIGELGMGLRESDVKQARRVAAYKVELALERPSSLADAWAQSAVSERPSPSALMNGLRNVPAAEVLRRARGLSNNPPAVWIEAIGREGLEAPKQFRFHRVPCGRF